MSIFKMYLNSIYTRWPIDTMYDVGGMLQVWYIDITFINNMYPSLSNVIITMLRITKHDWASHFFFKLV